MRGGGPCHLLVRAVQVELVKDKAYPWVMKVGGQLAVRKGSCAAFAELDVAVGVQPPVTEKILHLTFTLVHAAAALKHDWACSAAGEVQGGEYS